MKKDIEKNKKNITEMLDKLDESDERFIKQINTLFIKHLKRKGRH